MQDEGYAKACSRCGEVQPASSYYKDKRRSDGLYPQCKTCHQGYCKRWQAENKDRYDEYRAGWMREHRAADPEREAAIKRAFKERTGPTYESWKAMKNRCLNPNASDWRYYGGRGVTVCERWHDYAAFLEDMGERPDGLTIDRIDPDRGYEPGNCRWATRLEQSRNQRRHAGKEWAA